MLTSRAEMVGIKSENRGSITVNLLLRAVSEVGSRDQVFPYILAHVEWAAAKHKKYAT